jgi:hypothetical protein
LNPLGQEKKRNLLLRQAQPPHLDQVLGDLGYPLFTFVRDKVWPIDEFLVDLGRKEEVKEDVRCHAVPLQFPGR